MKLLSLCTGYGGLDRAVEEALGATTTWTADIDPGASKIIAQRFPHAPNLGDLATIDGHKLGQVDVIAGGTPCQDLSTAGRRAGMTDGTRSNLWVQMRRLIDECRPRYVVWENVRGAYSATAASAMESDPRLLGDHPPGQPVLRALGRVLGDLASLGYDARWYGLRASDIGACHHRFRIFVLAYAHGKGLEGLDRTAGAASAGRHGHAVAGTGGPDLVLPTPVADNSRGLPQPGTDFQSLPNVVCHLPTPSVADSQGGHLTRSGSRSGELLLPGVARAIATDWGQYAAAIGSHAQLVGRPAPEPTEPNARGGRRLAPRFVEWMMGAPDGWITDVPGVTRNEALKAGGNGVVPHQAAAALRRMIAA